MYTTHSFEILSQLLKQLNIQDCCAILQLCELPTSV